MKKFGIMVIAMAFLFLMVGIASAGPACIFANTTPPQMSMDDGVASATYSMTVGGIVKGSVYAAEDNSMRTCGGFNTARTSSLDLLASNGDVEFARETAGTIDGYDTAVLSTTAITYKNPSFGGGVAGSEKLTTSMASSMEFNENNTVGFNPFCEEAGTEFGFDLTSGSIATEGVTSGFVMPNMPNKLAYTAAITGVNDGGLATGAISMKTSVITIQGIMQNQTAVPTTMSEHSDRIKIDGAMSTAMNFNFQSTHGTGVPAGFPYSQIDRICK